ncbi:MAG: TolC family protein [Chloroflexia bacterium]|nr:TolC family protein [Chloroflexia bacterium]
MKFKIILIIIFLNISFVFKAQENDTLPEKWSFSDCVEYALTQNVQVRQSILTNLSNKVDKEQAVAQKLPSVNASVRQNFSWSKSDNSISDESGFSGSNSTSFGVNSSITIIMETGLII